MDEVTQSASHRNHIPESNSMDPSLGNYKILVADDDADILDLLQNILMMEHYEVVTATDGEQALALAQKENPDLIILDVMMPKMAGYEVCERIRADSRILTIPIMILTSLVSTKDRITGIKLGADAYVNKPFEIPEILARVEGLLNRWRENSSANPLTALPGANQLEREIVRRLTSEPEFSILRFDMDNIKEFNHRLGFDRGDMVIRLNSVLLRTAKAELGNRTDFICHKGGDDFILISSPDKATVIAARVLENFDALIPLQYTSAQEQPSSTIVPGIKYMSLSVGIADIDSSQYAHHAQVTERAEELLVEAKKQAGSAYFRNTDMSRAQNMR